MFLVFMFCIKTLFSNSFTGRILTFLLHFNWEFGKSNFLSIREHTNGMYKTQVSFSDQCQRERKTNRKPLTFLVIVLTLADILVYPTRVRCCSQIRALTSKNKLNTSRDHSLY